MPLLANASGQENEEHFLKAALLSSRQTVIGEIVVLKNASSESDSQIHGSCLCNNYAFFNYINIFNLIIFLRLVIHLLSSSSAGLTRFFLTRSAHAR